MNPFGSNTLGTRPWEGYEAQRRIPGPFPDSEWVEQAMPQGDGTWELHGSCIPGLSVRLTRTGVVLASGLSQAQALIFAKQATRHAIYPPPGRQTWSGVEDVTITRVGPLSGPPHASVPWRRVVQGAVYKWVNG